MKPQYFDEVAARVLESAGRQVLESLGAVDVQLIPIPGEAVSLQTQVPVVEVDRHGIAGLERELHDLLETETRQVRVQIGEALIPQQGEGPVTPFIVGPVAAAAQGRAVDWEEHEAEMTDGPSCQACMDIQPQGGDESDGEDGEPPSAVVSILVVTPGGRWERTVRSDCRDAVEMECVCRAAVGELAAQMRTPLAEQSVERVRVAEQVFAALHAALRGIARRAGAVVATESPRPSDLGYHATLTARGSVVSLSLVLRARTWTVRVGIGEQAQAGHNLRGGSGHVTGDMFWDDPSRTAGDVVYGVTHAVREVVAALGGRETPVVGETRTLVARVLESMGVPIVEAEAEDYAEEDEAREEYEAAVSDLTNRVFHNTPDFLAAKPRQLLWQVEVTDYAEGLRDDHDLWLEGTAEYRDGRWATTELRSFTVSQDLEEEVEVGKSTVTGDSLDDLETALRQERDAMKDRDWAEARPEDRRTITELFKELGWEWSGVSKWENLGSPRFLRDGGQQMRWAEKKVEMLNLQTPTESVGTYEIGESKITLGAMLKDMTGEPIGEGTPLYRVYPAGRGMDALREGGGKHLPGWARKWVQWANAHKAAETPDPADVKMDDEDRAGEIADTLRAMVQAWPLTVGMTSLHSVSPEEYGLKPGDGEADQEKVDELLRAVVAACPEGLDWGEDAKEIERLSGEAKAGEEPDKETEEADEVEEALAPWAGYRIESVIGEPGFPLEMVRRARPDFDFSLWRTRLVRELWTRR